LSKQPISNLPAPWTFKNAVCKEIGGEIFFFGDVDDPDHLDTNIVNTRLAKNICLSCEHVVECAEWGLHHEEFGVWGGLSSAELRDTRRKRNIIVQSIKYLVD